MIPQNRTRDRVTGFTCSHVHIQIYIQYTSISVSGLVFAAFAVSHRCTQVLEKLKCIISISEYTNLDK